MKKKPIKKVKRMPRWFYQQMFDGLMQIAILDKRMLKSQKMCEAIDYVADYLGDVAKKRK